MTTNTQARPSSTARNQPTASNHWNLASHAWRPANLEVREIFGLDHRFQIVPPLEGKRETRHDLDKTPPLLANDRLLGSTIPFSFSVSLMRKPWIVAHWSARAVFALASCQPGARLQLILDLAFQFAHVSRAVGP